MASIMIKYHQYPQRYKKAWESSFPWVQEVAGNPVRAFCRDCKIEMTAAKAVLSKHAQSRKHRFGKVDTSTIHKFFFNFQFFQSV